MSFLLVVEIAVCVFLNNEYSDFELLNIPIAIVTTLIWGSYLIFEMKRLGNLLESNESMLGSFHFYCDLVYLPISYLFSCGQSKH